jgi:hypothetical protein
MFWPGPTHDGMHHSIRLIQQRHSHRRGRPLVLFAQRRGRAHVYWRAQLILCWYTGTYRQDMALVFDIDDKTSRPSRRVD